MKEYTYSEARQRLAALLERARREGAVRIRRKAVAFRKSKGCLREIERARGTGLTLLRQPTRDRSIDERS